MQRIERTASENLEATSGVEGAAADVERTVERLERLMKGWGGGEAP